MEPIKFNDLNRNFLEDFIAKLPKEDKELLKKYLEDNPRDKPSSVFTLVKSYIYNTYFRTSAPIEHKKNNFVDVLDKLLAFDDNDDNDDNDENNDYNEINNNK